MLSDVLGQHFELPLKLFLPQGFLTFKLRPEPGGLRRGLSTQDYKGGDESDKLMIIIKPIGPLLERSKILFT